MNRNRWWLLAILVVILVFGYSRWQSGTMLWPMHGNGWSFGNFNDARPSMMGGMMGNSVRVADYELMAGLPNEATEMMASSNDEVSTYTKAAAPGSAPVAPGSTDRLVVRSGGLSLVVKDIQSAVKQIVAGTTARNGFVVSSQVTADVSLPSAVVVVRVPVDTFAASLEEFKKLGDVKSERMTGRDVTAEYVDVAAQVKNLQATEAQFVEIMKQATKIADVLAVQHELSTVRGQIEVLTGRLKYLKDTASLSVITFYLSTDPSLLPVLEEGNKWRPLAEAKDALRDLREVGMGLANVLIRLVIFAPLWLLLIWLLVRARRYWKNRKVA